MPDDDEVQFKSPSTGKVQAVPPEHWEEALASGYKPTTHTIMYSPEGERGMVSNKQLVDYTKRGYQTTPQTQFEKNVTGEGVSSKGVGTGIWDKLKQMVPPDPTGGHSIFSKEAWLGTGPTFDPAKSGLAQMGQEAASEYQRSRAAGSNPLAAGISAGVVGAGVPLGVSNQEQQALAEKGEGGQIIGQSAVPAAMAAAPLLGEFVPPAIKGARVRVGSSLVSPVTMEPKPLARLILGKERSSAFADVINPEFTKQREGQALAAAHEEMNKAVQEGQQKVSAAHDEMNKDIQSGQQKIAAAKAEMEADLAKEQAKLEKKAAVAGKAIPVSQSPSTYRGPASVPPSPPNPFAGMTSTATPIGNAKLPPVSPEQPAPMPMVTKAAGRKGLPPPPAIIDPNNPPPLDYKVTYQSAPDTEVIGKANGGDIEAVREAYRRSLESKLNPNVKFMVDYTAGRKPWRNLSQ